MAFLFVAFVLSFLSSISLPSLPALDFVRVNFDSGILREIRWGIWGTCTYASNDQRTCVHLGHGYAISLADSVGRQRVDIGASWTRGLAIHPVVTGIIAITFGFAASKYKHGPLVASMTSFFAALMLLIAFAADIALYAFVHHEVGKLEDVRADVNAGAAFWMTLVSLILVFMAHLLGILRAPTLKI
ncbi:hypothetical protein C8J57DRAFT_1714077 [Mycena rebaudengoi]|nr:hypothetical protein C8J57DRAFT_1714077 [Mycena rebaudengoi]